MEHIDALYELCDVVSRKIGEANDKIRMSGGELSGGDVEYIDKLTHTLKSIKTTIAMMESEDDGWSMAGGSYAQGNRGGQGGGQSRARNINYGTGGSYARGRGRNAKRDSMGRYSSEGGNSMRRYSRNSSTEQIVRQLDELMRDADDEEVREALREARETISMD